MRHNYFFVALLSLAAISCSISEIDNPEVGDNSFRMPESIYAVIDDDPGNTDTKVYADNQLRVLWNHDDRITYWNNYTYGYEYAFQGSDGANAGNFSRVGNGPDGPVTGNDLGGMIYSIYPHRSDTEIDNDGNISFTLPAEQTYKERSFGRGANTMVSRTETPELRFKNVGGYLSFKLYGQDVYVTSITLKGNNHEKLAGKCTIGFSGGLPAVTMDAQQATEEITLTCNPPVALGSSSADFTEFWMVIPPVEFSGGITFTVTTLDGGTYEKSSTSRFSIVRNVKKSVPAMKVTAVLSGDIDFEDEAVEDICVAYWDTDESGSLSYAEAAAVTSLFVDEALTRSGENLVSAFAGTNIETFDELIYFTGLTEIEAGAFAGCTGLESVVIPETITTIGENAFNGCTSLGSIVLSSDVPPTIGAGAFANTNNCPIYVPEGTAETYTGSTGWTVYADRIFGAVLPSSFPDPNFRAYVFENFDTNQDGVLFEEECDAVTRIEVNTDNIVSLQGVELFTNLSYLKCIGSSQGSGKLSSLDVSQNTALQTLYCYCNQLTSLDVSGLTALKDLSFYDNSLTSIDVSQNTALQVLYCSYNQLTSLDVSQNTALRLLYCFYNQLTSLDVSGLTALQYIECYSNQLTSLDVSGCTALQYLHCYNNQLSSIDVSGLTALTSLSCYNNQMTSLNVNGCTALQTLNSYNNQLTSLGVSGCTALQILVCQANQLSSLDVSGCTALVNLYCHSNQLTSLNVSGCIALQILNCVVNPLTSLDVSGCTALQSLVCQVNQLTSLDVSDCTALQVLKCNDNQLTSLDVSNNTSLTELDCRANRSMATLYLATWQEIQTLWKDASTQIVYKPLAVPEAVDLGLSVKWASFNLGATSPEEYGDYFAWGETDPYYQPGSAQSPSPVWKSGKSDGYAWASYRFNPSGDGQTFTKYNKSDYTTLRPEDDAASVYLGGNWRIPTEAECDELIDNCDWVWTENYNNTGIKGYVVTSRMVGYTGNSLFLPAAGSFFSTSLRFVGSNGSYWSSTRVENSSGNSGYISLGSNSVRKSSSVRFLGASVRPVSGPAQNVSVESISLNINQIEMSVGSSAFLTATILPSNATNKNYNWSSSDESVATVSSSGVVTGVAVGSAVITVTTVDGSKTATCSVTATVPSPYSCSVPAAVDLGLSVKWASFNLGATSPEEYGDYFAWGETEPYYSSLDPLAWKEGKTGGYTFNSNRFSVSGTLWTYTKYTGSDYTTLQPEDDAATVNLGGNWRLPTDAEREELRNTDNCDWVWTENYNNTGVDGYVITSKIAGYIGNSIFLPVAGEFTSRQFNNDPSRGWYWTSSLESNNNTNYIRSIFIPSDEYMSAYGINELPLRGGTPRYNGCSIRPVTTE